MDRDQKTSYALYPLKKITPSTYDDIGSRTLVESSLGAKIAFNHNELGQVSHLAGAQAGQDAWAATVSYNALGQEELRKVSGGVVSSWQYDAMGRPVGHQVRGARQETRVKTYDWDVNQRLRKVTDELTKSQISFSYDQFSNLVQAKYGFNDILYRETDEFGNLYKTEDKIDRIYGKGSRLEQSEVNTKELKHNYGKLATKGAIFEYDCEGNLVKKVSAPDPNEWTFNEKGEVVYFTPPTWKYEYYGNGMLKKVIKPDGETVTFKYDSLGRRVEKSSDSKIIKFVWDGNNPLHEWEEDNQQDSLTTWVFKDSFVPSAKLTNQGNYSIITDHLGTPVEAYDSEGKKVWEQELDIYGRVRPKPVVKKYGRVIDVGKYDDHFIPFRYQGQYADRELNGELYYNWTVVKIKRKKINKIE